MTLARKIREAARQEAADQRAADRAITLLSGIDWTAARDWCGEAQPESKGREYMVGAALATVYEVERQSKTEQTEEEAPTVGAETVYHDAVQRLCEAVDGFADEDFACRAPRVDALRSRVKAVLEAGKELHR